MKRRVTIMLAVLILALPAVGVTRRVSGVSLIWTGTYIQDDPTQNLTGRCPETGCVGDLVTCAPSEVITVTKKTFSYVALVCDDRTDEYPPCDGRITALVEECAGPEDTISVGQTTTVYSTGAARICKDSGDCTGATPSEVVGRGTTRTQMRFIPGSSPPSGTSTTQGMRHSRFSFEGNPVRFFREGGRITHFVTAQPNDGENCGGGCAVAGASAADRS